MFGAFNHILMYLLRFGFFVLKDLPQKPNSQHLLYLMLFSKATLFSSQMSYFPPVQNVPLPGMRWPKWRCVTVKTLCVNCRRQQTKMTWSSSTTECPRRPARPSLTSPTTSVGRIASMSCTSIRPKTTPSCRYKTR